MKISRRDFLGGSAALAAVGVWGLHPGVRAAAEQPWRLSACDWSLRASGPEGLATAKQAGLEGLEISAGGPGDTVALADAALRGKYREQSAETGVAISSVAMGFLNRAPLATDPRGPAWLEQTIDAAHDLDVRVVLLAFFGKGDLRQKTVLKKDAIDTVVKRLQAAAPRAEEKGVVLGLENTLSGEDNMRILERVGSDAVQVYYDIGNATVYGYDVPGEIRALDERICQIHFKDGGHFLGEGQVEVPAAAQAIKDIGYKGWLVLETAIPTKDNIADFRRNAAYVREVFEIKA